MSINVVQLTKENLDELCIEQTLSTLYSMRGATIQELENRIGGNLEETLCELNKREWIEPRVFHSYGETQVRWCCTETGKKLVEAKAKLYTLEPQDACAAQALALADVPVTVLLAAAYLRGDSTNKAMIAGTWPGIVMNIDAREWLGDGHAISVARNIISRIATTTKSFFNTEQYGE